MKTSLVSHGNSEEFVAHKLLHNKELKEQREKKDNRTAITHGNNAEPQKISTTCLQSNENINPTQYTNFHEMRQEKNGIVGVCF